VSKGGKGEFWRDFFALGPIVVGVALEAAGFGVILAGGMAGLAGGDARHEHVGGEGAGEGFFVATGAGEALVGLMIEFGVGHPVRGGVGGGDRGQNGGGRGDGSDDWSAAYGKRVALNAGFAPEELLGVGGAFGDPLLLGENAHGGLRGFFGEVAVGIAQYADF